ncbi:L-dopachrome tautomerase-related protein [Luteolibacter sp. LG18]|uniref:SMP-30/gluconolactonase/LRE family protein n=1 Tax=Luteolibacter sp. LG18 TaxID=2819286 RepID=UPI002B2CF843|nr:hypothetical protein llg_40370 [Luteolibacter sp. LG18]
MNPPRFLSRCVAVAGAFCLPALHAEEKLIEVASFGDHQPIGMAVSGEPNRVFVSFPHREPFANALLEITDGKQAPFPNAEWNVSNPTDEAHHFINAQDLFADDRHNLWLLDSAPSSGASILNKDGTSTRATGRFKVVKIDLTRNEVAEIYPFDDLPKDKSALNDLCIDHTHGLAYLSDPGLKAIVVLDLKTKQSRVVLRDDPAMLATPGFKLTIDGKEVVDGSGRPFVSNVNGIALTHDDRWFYFRAINQTWLRQIETRWLADASLSDQELSAKIEKVAETGVCHGMVADKKGNIYVTDSQAKAIRYVTPEGKVETLVHDERLIWPDSLGIGSDGYLYLTASQICRDAKFNGGKPAYSLPFRAYKVKLP